MTVRIGARQQKILDYIQEYTAQHGFAPSVREIANAVGLASPSTVKHHLDNMEQSGLISRKEGSPRALVVSPQYSQNLESPQPPTNELGQSGLGILEELRADQHVHDVPLVGHIAAGAPILAEQSVEDVFTLPTRVTGTGDLFALEVKGDSMIDAAICDGDYVVVRAQPTAAEGETVAALLDDEATVKILSFQDEHTWLMPRNPDYSPILGDDAVILGKVVTVIRSL